MTKGDGVDAYERNLAFWRSRCGRTWLWAIVPLAYGAPVASEMLRGVPTLDALGSWRALVPAVALLGIIALHRRAFGRDDDGPRSPRRHGSSINGPEGPTP